MADRAGASRSATEKMVDRVAEDLVHQILLGTISARSHLPPVRRLAEQYEVNVSTILRVVAQLEALGLVEVRQGSGAVVCDVRSAGGLELFPLMLSAYASDPDRAGKILADYLEVRRIVAVNVVQRIFTGAVSLRLGPIEAAVARFDKVLASEQRDLRVIARADGAVTRAVLEQMDQIAMISIVNLLERMILGNETLLETLYREPELSQTAWHRLLVALHDEERPANRLLEVEALIAAVDEGIVRRFVEQLKEKKGG